MLVVAHNHVVNACSSSSDTVVSCWLLFSLGTAALCNYHAVGLLALIICVIMYLYYAICNCCGCVQLFPVCISAAALHRT